MSARTRLGVALAYLCLTAGCAVGPNFHRPDAPPVAKYTHGSDPTTTVAVDGTAQRFHTGEPVAADWWRLFQSAQLDGIVSDAIAHNPGLDAAQASLRASQDNLRSGYGIFYPTIDADVGATRQRYTPADIGEKAPSTVFNLFTLSTSVSYALDIFGGQRRLVEGLRAEVDVAHADERAAYLALAANIVNTVIAKAAYRAEVQATLQLVILQKQQVALGEVQAQAGTVPYSTVLSLRSQLASYEATIPQLEQKFTQSAHLLAALTGHVPAEWSAPRREPERPHPAERPAGQPAVRARAPASGHPRGRSPRPCRQRQYRGRHGGAAAQFHAHRGSCGCHQFDPAAVSRQRPGLECGRRCHGAAIRRRHALVQAQGGDGQLQADDGALSSNRPGRI